MATILNTTKELKGKSYGAKSSAIDEFLSQPVSPLNLPEKIESLQRDLDAYSRKYEMSSEEMREKVCSGQLECADEYLEWSHKYKLLGALKFASSKK